MEEMLGDRPQVTIDLGPSLLSKPEIEALVADLVEAPCHQPRRHARRCCLLGRGLQPRCA
jgi:hypothetical protein